MTEDELFLTAILNCSRSELLTRSSLLTESQQQLFNHMKLRRSQGEPIQYICQFTEFMGYRINVGKGVLIPRPETEILVDEVVKILKHEQMTSGHLLDLGVGSGCIAISLLKQMPSFFATGIDISSSALSFAQQNTIFHQLRNRLSLYQEDMFSFLKRSEESFDVIISNPPYIPTNDLKSLPLDVQQEPRLALDGGNDGLNFYREMIPLAKRCLKHKGFLAYEFGDGQEKELQNILAHNGGWDKIQVFKDLNEKERIIIARKKE